MIKSLEDLKVWQKARDFNKKIYDLTSTFPSIERTNLTIQLRRASSSVCANIAEGFGRYHFQESMQFYRTARGSLSEIKSHLLLSLDQNYLTKPQSDKLFTDIDEIAKMLNGLIGKTKLYRSKSSVLSSNN